MNNNSQPLLPEIENKAHQNIVKAIQSITDFLEGAKPDIIKVEEYEDYYKRLRGLKGFYDNAHWDTIEKDLPGEKWLKESRQDKEFKKYYKLRMEFDRLEVLVK